MNKRIKIIYNNQLIEANVVRFFKKGNQVYLIYSFLEKDENDYIKLYVSKIFNQGGRLIGMGITDENEYKNVKIEIQDIIRANREHLQPNIVDLDSSILNNLQINDRRAFKLLEQSINLLEKRNEIKSGTDNYEQLYLKEQQNNLILVNMCNDLKENVNILNKKIEEISKFIEANR